MLSFFARDKTLEFFSQQTRSLTTILWAFCKVFQNRRLGTHYHKISPQWSLLSWGFHYNVTWFFSGLLREPKACSFFLVGDFPHTLLLCRCFKMNLNTINQSVNKVNNNFFTGDSWGICGILMICSHGNSRWSVWVIGMLLTHASCGRDY